MKTISLKQLHKIALGIAAAAVLGLGLGRVHSTANPGLHSTVAGIRLADSGGQESHGGGKGGHLMPPHRELTC